MNFYIASKFENYPQVREVASLLKNRGWTHTHDWTANASVKNLLTDGDTLRAAGQNCFDGIRAADVVIVLTPQGRGTHTELGMALALGKKVILYHPDGACFGFDDNTSPFYWLPQVRQVTGSLDDLMAAIEAPQRDPD